MVCAERSINNSSLGVGMKTSTRSLLLAATVAALGMVSTGDASASPITPGNLVIYRVGDGAAALGTTATAAFLDEYTVAGGFVQSIPLPSTGASALTNVGNATTEGIISRSQDGNYLVFAGYRKDAGGTNPSSDAPATTNRVIGTLDITGNALTSTAITDPTGTIRSATTVDGTTYYFATSAAVRYVATPSGSSTSAQIDARNSRQVNLSGNTLYASNGSTAITAKVQSYGALPTGATAPTTVVNLLTADAVNGFFLCDMSAGVAGDDTLYCLSTVAGQLLKYTFDGTNWNASGSIASAASNLVGIIDGSNVNIYLTSASTLSGLQDTSGYGGTITGTISPLATAGTNTAFRGIGSFVVPEPGSLSLLCAAGLLAMRRRSRN